MITVWKATECKAAELLAEARRLNKLQEERSRKASLYSPMVSAQQDHLWLKRMWKIGLVLRNNNFELIWRDYLCKKMIYRPALWVSHHHDFFSHITPGWSCCEPLKCKEIQIYAVAAAKKEKGGVVKKNRLLQPFSADVEAKSHFITQLLFGVSLR